MTPVQKVLVKLLDEIADICASRDICYSFADRLAWDAYKFGGFHDKTYDAYLCMSEKDLDRFVEYMGVAQPEMREIELCQKRKLRDKCSVRYIDTSTLLLDMGESKGSIPGIAVTINPLKWLPRNGGFSYPSPDGSWIQFSDDLLQSITQVKFEGCNVPIFTDCNQFFSKIVGENWQNTKYNKPIRSERFGVITDVALPYAEFMISAKIQNLYTDELKGSRAAFNSWIEKSLVPVENKIKVHQLILKRSGERFRLWEKYYPHKQEILSLVNEGAANQLALVFEDYCETLKWFYSKGMTVCFDRDMFDVAVSILREQEFTGANDLERLIPESHRIDLVNVIKY